MHLVSYCFTRWCGGSMVKTFVATPLRGNGRMRLTLPKLGLGSPPGLPKLQSSIVGVKTPCIDTFFISSKSY
jgi:hypothetical protein